MRDTDALMVYMAGITAEDLLAASQSGYAAGVWDGLMRVCWYFIVIWVLF